MKKHQPFSQCTRCQSVNGLINERCLISYIGKKRCKGVNRSMIAGDWKECPRCLTEGCADCRNIGWFNIRKNI